MASEEEATVQGLFVRLNEQVKAGQRKKALRTVEEVLKASPKDVDALKTKAVLLIDLDRFEDAIDLCDKHKLHIKLGFEKVRTLLCATSDKLLDARRIVVKYFLCMQAYCLYRLGKLKESMEALERESQDANRAGVLQLRAQLQYRLGLFSDAISSYEELFKDPKAAGDDTRTNIAAAYASSQDTSKFDAVAKSLGISAKGSFEMAFNLACIKLHTGELEQAKELLLLGLRSGQESLLDDEYTSEQVEQELAPLAVQLAYATTRSGQHADALEQYKRVLAQDLGDEGTRAVAVNNRITQEVLLAPAERQKTVVQDAVKQLDSLFEKGAGLRIKSAVAARLSASQQLTIYINRVLLLSLAGRTPLARDLLSQLLKRYPDAQEPQILRATMLAKDEKPQEAEAILRDLSPEKGGKLLLLRAQIALQGSDPAKAAELLASMPKQQLSQQPAFVASQAAVLEAAGRPEEALSLVRGAHEASAATIGKSQAARKELDQNVLPILARLELKAGKVEAAFKSFQQLHSTNASAASNQVISQLANAALAQDPSAAISLQEHLEELPSVSEADVADFEAAGTKRKAKGDRANKEGAELPKRRKRKKQKRLPKSFDPDNPGPLPDPERWLPKWQRSDFKRKRRNRRDKDKGKTAHQGGAVDESLDRTNTETPVAAPSLPPKRGRARGKAGRR